MAHVRNAWYVAAWSHELVGSKPIGMKILGELIAIYRAESGRLIALEDRCVHRLAPLSLGRCEGERLRCMYHGLLYDPDGAVVAIPGQDVIPAQARVRSYPVADRHGWIWVWPGDPEHADEALIPSVVGPDHPDYVLGTGYLDYEAEAHLINENLLDFSHIAYVHENSFRLGPEMAEAHAAITTLDRGIRYVRWLESLPFDAQGRTAAPLDSYMSYDFLIPGLLLMSIASFPLGTAKRCAYGLPDMSLAVRDVSFTGQAVTPMGAKATRYFFSYGPHRNFGTEAMLEPMMDLVKTAFFEDKVMIEAQQRVIDDTPAPAILPTSHDRSITMFNRMVDRLLRAEIQGAAA